MAEKKNAPLVNFVNGEWSPLMAARIDSEDYNKSLAWCQNFIVLPQGGANYRPGTFAVGLTPLNVAGALIRFQFSASDGIMIEATQNLFRFIRNNQYILNTATAITGITQANPGVVTSTAHGLTAGQQVYITGVFGMSQVNGNYFTVSATGLTANTFQMQDQFGNNVNTTAYSAYASGGTVASVYSIATPYNQADLFALRTAQVADVMYIVHRNYAPQKLVRAGFTSWTIGTFSRTNDPFSGVQVTPTGVTNANPAVVTVASTTGMVTGDSITVIPFGISGMTQLNGNTYKITVINATTFSLQDPVSGANINSTGYGVYSGARAGAISDVNNWPASVCFTMDGRLAYANSRQNPQGLWVSELPTGTTTNYDVFTTGTNANNAYAYQFAPVEGIIDSIQEIKSFGGMLAMLGASSVAQVYGSQTNTPPNVTAINTQVTLQGAAHVQPIGVNWSLLFIDSNGQKLRALQYNLLFSNYETVDHNKNSPHFGEESPFIKMVYVKGTPAIIWILRADGTLLSFTYDNVEKIAAFARHYPASGGVVIDIATIRNASGNDQLWMMVQRTLNGVAYTSVEVLSNWPNIPLRRKFYTGKNNQASDEANWEAAAWESLKPSTFLDMSLTYDGSLRGVAAGATLTPSGLTGNITLTASAAVFQPSDVGSYLWKEYSATGSGGGQCQITGYTNSTTVSATVTIPFDVATAIPAGSWEFAVTTLTNLQLFASQTVSVQADGGPHPAVTVTSGGQATLQYPASVIQIGFGYTGLISTQNLAQETRTGANFSKPRNIKRIRARFDQSIGGMIGASEYRVQDIVTNTITQIPNRVPAPFTGARDMNIVDQWSNSTKNAVFVHTQPTPLTLLGFDVEDYTSEPP